MKFGLRQIQIFLIIIIIFSIFSVLKQFSNVSCDLIDESILEIHKPIYISNNSQFIFANGVNSGNGTKNNPYILENWKINASNNHGIWIENTNSYFIIRNCYVFKSKVDYYGIYLNNTNNGTIENGNIENNRLNSNRFGIRLLYSNNNLIHNNDMNSISLVHSSNISINNNSIVDSYSGISLGYSKNVIIEKNTIEQQKYAINLRFSYGVTINNNICNFIEKGAFNIEGSDNNIISNNICNSESGYGVNSFISNSNTYENNTFSLNNSDGISLFGSNSAIIKNNFLFSCSLKINGYKLSHWSTHIIDITNIANNEPVYYWKNIKNKKLPIVRGEIILANCTNISIENQKIKPKCIGIQIGFSFEIKISNNSCNSIFVSGSENNIISNNNCNRISIAESNFNTISNNKCNSSGDYGIYLLYSESNEIKNNILSNHWSGLYLYANSNIIINNLFLNNQYGITLSKSENNIFKYNNISNNQYGIYLEWNAQYNKFFENRIMDNFEIGFLISKYSKNNIIHHNNFISNFKQALDNGTNQWDDSISEGNYWSDWTTPDEDKNGIIDKPYEIPGTAGSKDNYPISKRYILFPNLAPKINRSIGNIEIFEDTTIIGLINLFDWFYDPNGDPLLFKTQSTKNISITINNNGDVVIDPKKDWNGNETLTFYANDSVYEINDNVNINVLGVNDPPQKPEIIKPLDNESFEILTKINFTSYCYDVDEIYKDILNYTWISNISGIIGFGKEIENITLPIGNHTIILTVTDLMNETNQANVIINIFNISMEDDDKNNITNNSIDTDNDNIPDYWEQKYGLNITDPLDAEFDFDNDNLTNLEEYLNHTNPLNLDTDNDSYNDGLEVYKGANPLDNEDYPKLPPDDEKEDNGEERKLPDASYMAYLIIGIIIIIFLILLALFISKKRKRKKE